IVVPPGSTLTSVSNGTAVLDVSQWLHFLDANGLEPRDIREMAEALEEAEDMVSAWPDDTGLPNAIKIIPGNPAHGPRIKVALKPTDRFTGEWASILFGEAKESFDPPRPGRAGGPLPSAALLRQLREFIELNRTELYAFDREPDKGGISGAQLIKGLRKV